ncbi:hypothetical protein CC1G_05697 [Coprinopsis cinerea okayama7|uniref:Uncharacterized protein n=1 Tax=Coprinopsis cinerea (strain Okayama-7 / 130 / ATCC MYA-4618 / FGSC 9003) TaxID=240176 RepID=A8N9X0_COPC7|nr:hypothetical protein CC1G_05697 [Coprinopsis cinerea okayama7\|eukprot:XP_001831626.1 hypothetical protein CC1G_05697 [Coprinopsis cinerea okayama7\
MLKNGSFAVAVIQRQVVVVQATRTHSKRDKQVDVVPYIPFGGSDGLFLVSPVSNIVHIPSSDILTVLSEGSPYPEYDSEYDTPPSSPKTPLRGSFGTSKESANIDQVDVGMIRLPPRMLEEYVRLSEKQVRRNERAWNAWVSRR